jgi:thymidylate synthase (FAD)
VTMNILDQLSTITIKPTPQGEVYDVMAGAARLDIQVHEHGLMALVDVMPRLVPSGQTADAAIVQAARVSYGEGTKKVSDDRGLIRYLLRNRHTTPFEMIEFKFHMKMPIFLARQWIRHRTANVNESSARYSELPGTFWFPKVEDVRGQGTGGGNKQVAEGQMDAVDAAYFVRALHAQCDIAYERYQTALTIGVGRELARVGLPLNIYTEWYWKCDLHNILHFLSLRLDAHAQQEIRDFAIAMYALIKPIVPIACEAFEDYRLGGMHLSRLEIEALYNDKGLATTNKRELAEWEEKKGRLFDSRRWNSAEVSP